MTNTKNACRFCNYSLPDPIVPDLWDLTIIQSERFRVVPSRGALVPGWLLIVPQSHYLNLGQMTDDVWNEFLTIRDQTARMLRSAFGPICQFEHGPVAHCQQVGCGVDHAHLHLVPFEADLRELAKEVWPGCPDWLRVPSIASTQETSSSGSAYLYLEANDGTGWIATDPLIPSQVFRKAIATHLGIPQQYDWKKYDGTSNVAETLARLKVAVPSVRHEAGSYVDPFIGQSIISNWVS